MTGSNRYSAVILTVLFSLLMVTCATPVETSGKIEPVHLEPIAGTELNRLTLTERAAERLGIQTAPVREEIVNGERRKIIPYAAVVYDVNGGAWVYTSSEPLTFVREAIVVERIEGDVAVLLEGPEPGTEVAIVGVAELYGADTGVG